MRKARKPVAEDEMLPEYDFTGAVRGKYYRRFKASSNVVVLDPDVSAAFPNAASVNQALRSLASVARRSVPVVRRTSSVTRRPNNRMQEELTTSAHRPRKRGPRS